MDKFILIKIKEAFEQSCVLYGFCRTYNDFFMHNFEDAKEEIIQYFFNELLFYYDREMDKFDCHKNINQIQECDSFSPEIKQKYIQFIINAVKENYNINDRHREKILKSIFKTGD